MKVRTRLRWWMMVWAGLALLVGCPQGGITVNDDDDSVGDDDDDDNSGDDDDATPGDQDGDGWLSDEDCDDHDPDVNPDAEEVADGVDNDCDGTIDTQFVCDDGSGHYEEIQEGIDLAPEGFVLEVCPGTYQENLVLNGKILTVRSMDGPDVTIVQGDGSSQVWTVSHINGPGSGIEGFTIVGGVSTQTGGGIVCDDALLSISDCVITGNSGLYGGGLLANDCSVDVTDNEIVDNVSSDFGGGVFLYQSNGTLGGNLISDNTGLEGGGLAVNGGNVEITDNEILRNETTCEEEYCGGGGVWLAGNSPMTYNTINDNVSTRMGGGVYLYDSSGDVHGNDVSNNVAYEDGGGVYSFYGSSSITENTISSNEAWDDAGGLRLMTGTCVVEDNIISYNTCADGGGGAKFSHSINSFVRNHLEGNVAGDEGGGLDLDNDITPVEDCTFLDNQASRGAGIHSDEAWGDVWVIDTLLEGNVATDRGGAIQFSENTTGTGHILNVIATNNQAAYGGAISVFDSNSFSLANSILDGNRASIAGGGVYLDNTPGDVVNLTIHDNQAPAGAGFAQTDCTGVDVLNTIIADNPSGPGVTISGTAPNWNYNDVWGSGGANYSGMTDPTGTGGNLSQDPNFDDPNTGDFSLLGNSPCINAGTPALTDAVDGTRSDMGAYGGPYGSWP